MTKIIAVLLFISLSSCGFQVIYKEKVSDSDISYVNELAAIRIKKDRVLVSQELKNNLYDALNPDYIKAEPKYFLTLSITESISPTYIAITGSSGRNKISITVSYKLKSLKTAEVIAEGVTTVEDNYDVGSNRYGSYVAENYVRVNLTKIAAQNTRNSLVNDFIELKRKCDEALTDKNFSCPL
jgi:hypothetical protein